MKKKEARKGRQCMVALPTHRGGGLVFCQKTEGHDGSHRGKGAQWNDEGKRVPITEPPVR